jgi:hypothetical protein
LPVPGTQQAADAGSGHITVGAPGPAEAARAGRFAGKRPGRAPCTSGSSRMATAPGRDATGRSPPHAGWLGSP